MHRLFSIPIVAALLCLWLPSITFAQSISQPEPVQYIVAPENPGPHAPVNIEVQGVGTFLGDATITWNLNGKRILSGTGERIFSFTTEEVGKATTVNVVINSTAYGVISKTFSFNPSQIELVWEADTTIPPLYAGRALPSPGARVKIVAFPSVVVSGKKISPTSLSYQWSVNGSAKPQSSGTGRNVFLLESNQLHQSALIALDVYSNSIPMGRAEAVIPFVSPLLVLYERDPLQGILYNRALVDTFSLQKTETTVRAEPYFFATPRSSALNYSWLLNNSETTGPNAQSGELTLRQVGNAKGEAQLQVSLQNTGGNLLLQAAQTLLTLSFGETGASLLGI